MRNTTDTQSNSGRIPGPSRRSILRAAGWGGLASALTLSARALGGRSLQDPGDGPGGDPEDPGREGDPAPLETRTMAQLYQAAIDEGGELVVVEGGDSIHQEDGTKSAFLAQFPKINLSLTVDLSKYNDARIDLAFDKGTTPPDVAHLQTLQDFTRWKRQGRLLNYKPLGWEHVYSQFKDPDGAWTGLIGLMFSNIANTTIIPASQAPRNYLDYLDPKYKDKLVFLYPNDNDAALFTFHQAIEAHGWSYMDDLMKNNPLFVRGAARVDTIVASGEKVASFTGITSPLAIPGSPIQLFLPTDDKFLAWAQRAAIFKNAAHPNAAKLWTSWHLQPSTQQQISLWPVRDDIAPSNGLQPIVNYTNGGLAEFPEFVEKRAAAERFRAKMQLYVGDPLGPDPGTTF